MSKGSPIAIYGIPRSGFTLTIGLILNLIDFNSHQLRTLLKIDKKLGEKLLKPFIESLENKTNKEIYFSGEFSSLTGGPKELKDKYIFSRKYIGIKDIGDITVSIAIPKILEILIPIYHSHILDSSVKDRKISIITMRHPCGIFESSINSFNALTSEYLQKEVGRDKSKEERYRKELALYKMTDPTIKNALLSYLNRNMGTYSESYDIYKKNITPITWEGLLSNSFNNFEKIHDVLKKIGIQTSVDNIQKELNKFSFINTLKYHKHNFRPGHAQINGWLSELPQEIISEIINLNFSKRYIEIHQENLFRIIESSITKSNFSLDAQNCLKTNRSFKPALDPNILEFSLNKTNVDQDLFAGQYIVNLDLGNIIIHRMSKDLKNLLPSFEKLSLSIKKLEEDIYELIDEQTANKFFNNFPDLPYADDILKKLKNLFN